MVRDAGAPGVAEAYEVVRTDIARRISKDLVASNEAGEFPGLENHHQFDSSIPFNPELFSTDPDKHDVESLGQPSPGLFDEAFSKPPITSATAQALAAIGAKLIPEHRPEGAGDVARAISDVDLPVDRLARIAKQRHLSTDPDAKASYDIVAVDLGTRLSVVMAEGIARGHLDKTVLTKNELTLVGRPARTRLRRPGDRGSGPVDSGRTNAGRQQGAGPRHARPPDTTARRRALIVD